MAASLKGSKKEKKGKEKSEIEIVLNKTDSPPILVSFPEGVVMDDLNLELSESKSSVKTQLLSETEKLSITGSNFSRNSISLNTAQWAVGIYEASSQSMTVYPVNHVFPLRSVIKGYEASAVHADASKSRAASAREHRALLFEDFGASKKKRALAASAANQVSAEQAVGAEALSGWMGSGDHDEGQDNEDATDVALTEGIYFTFTGKILFSQHIYFS